MLKSVFSAHFNDEQIVNETKCYALGDNYCSFIIQNKE
ncbi:MAG: hypothetical protein PHY59_07805 [Methanobacterium sp.]|nr:hypothetical protein [Methanobacterium sp.]